MGMGEDDAEEVAAVGLDEGGVGENDVDAGVALVAELDPEIDHDPLPPTAVVEAVEIGVHADLARPSERQEQ